LIKPELAQIQAAVRAGYSAKTAEQLGYQLLQKPSVAIAIQATIRAGHSRKTADASGPRMLGNVGVAATTTTTRQYRYD
jgi:phage terminase small subunit